MQAIAPRDVSVADLITFDLDSNAINARGRPVYRERYIHGEIYKVRPDVNAVVHSHAEETLPFGITAVPLQPVIHVASVIGPTIPVWDIAEQFGDATNLLVTTVDQGRDLAQCLGQNQVALMRGHGFAAVGATIMDVVRVSVYLPVNARVLTTAMRFGPFKPLAPGEIANRVAFNPRSAAGWRAWEYWARRAGVGELLGDMP
jgi:HCOMODA/2-hydroxy-3-carboxy-muconic semialdehyde decarboxylase